MKLRHAFRLIGLLILLLSVSFGARAWAEVSPTDAAAAESLFQEARKLMKENRFAEACERFAASRRLHPGVGTSLNLADCLEKLGRTASAYGMFNETAVEAQRMGDKMGRDVEARARARALEPRLSKLSIVVPPAHRVAGLTVRRDGEALGQDLWGLAIPVDPGEHIVEASAAGRAPWKGAVQIKAEPGLTTAEVPELTKVVPAPSKVEGGAGKDGKGGNGGNGGKGGKGGWSAQRTAGVVVAGAGVVGVVVGTVFGVQVLSKDSDAAKYCRPNDPYFCTAPGVALRREMHTAGTVSTVMFVVGGAALVGGGVLFLTAKSAGEKGSAAVRWEASPMVAGSGSGGGLSLRTRW